MHLIFMVHSSNSEYNGDCDYAVVDLTPALVEEIRSRAALVRQAAKQDSQLDEICFWGHTAEFYSTDVVDACQEAVAATAAGKDPNEAATDWFAELQSRGYAVVPPGVDLSNFEAQRTEIDRMIVNAVIGRPGECEISWKSTPKHADLHVNTWDLPLSAMEALIASVRSDQEHDSPAADVESVVHLPCYGITVWPDRKPSAEEPASGTITSDLKRDTTSADAEYRAAIDGLESLILAHACAGIDVTTPAYIEGIETAVEAIANHHGG